jgi:hypothetical protein
LLCGLRVEHQRRPDCKEQRRESGARRGTTHAARARHSASV